MNTITLRSGTEGPKHDPYAYEEIIADCRNGRVTCHLGLAEWTEVQPPGRAPKYRTELYPRQLFEALVGVTPETAVRSRERAARRRVSSHLRQCRSHLVCFGGHPGESLECCHKCGEVLRCHFDRSAVE